MRYGGKYEKSQNGRSRINGKTGNGAYQETSKYIGNPEGGLLGVGKSAKSAIGHAQYLCPEIEFEPGTSKEVVIDRTFIS